MNHQCIPVISFVAGKSGSGKTTLLEKVIKRLKEDGIRVASIKHDVHDFDMDKPGKDTWRLAQAGSDIVAISSPGKVAIIAMISGVDLIVTEGFKLGSKPKIEVHRSVVHGELVCKTSELLAIASDVVWDVGVPCFSINDVEGIAGHIKWYTDTFSTVAEND